VLITYATRYGSTQQVAAAIAEELTSAGLDVDVLSAGPQSQVAKYDAVVVGSPSYGRNWLPSAALFVIGNASRLSAMPVALFTTGMLGVKSPKSALQEHERIMATIQELSPGFVPVSTALFHGSFDRSRLPLCLRLMDRLAGTPQGDHRDWEAIRGWARRVGERFPERLNGGPDDGPIEIPTKITEEHGA
jgi:menaquinone-dependent protoporphyrinogen oxidase